MDDSDIRRVFTLLRAKDDTSRFVGLTILHSVLDSRPHIRTDTDLVAQIWRNIPKRFLVRLMKTQSNNATNENAQNMRHLAVAIIHSFTALLSSEELETQDTISLCLPLLDVLPFVDKPQQVLALQALQLIAGHEAGASLLLGSIELPKAILASYTRDTDENGAMKHLLSLVRIIRTGHALSPSHKLQWNTMILEILSRLKPHLVAFFDMLTDVSGLIEVNLVNCL
jgi:hypothetical protein